MGGFKMENFAAHAHLPGQGPCGIGSGFGINMKDNNFIFLILIGLMLFPNLLNVIMQNPIIIIVALMMFM